MLFNSIDFVFFFPIVIIIYYMIPAAGRYIWLLAASYYFYAGWNPSYVFLLLFITLVTFINGMWIDIYPREHQYSRIRKILLIENCGICLAVLFFYKYLNFALGMILPILHRNTEGYVFEGYNIILPVGISFFTFQALSYTIDVYRGTIKAERNLFLYALFVSFFPQLVAGPIERSDKLMYQLKKPEKFSFDAARDGFMLMLWGYFLKIVIADRASIIVDTVYGDIDSYHGWYLIIATMLFAVQIYCDFAGYSIIAAGSAKILGIRLMENFNAPYTAVSVTDFWRRWHISLSTWFRDYVYIPLGGNRKGALRKEWNRIIVFLLSGLWHGANLTFVVWGGINGLYQMIGDFTRPMRLKIVRMLRLRPATAGFKIYQALVTFLLIDFSWIFFRADDIHQANTIIHSIFHADNPWILLDGSLYGLGLNEKNVHLLVICIIVLLAADILKHNGICIRNILIQQDYPVRWLVFTFSIWFILTFGIWGAVYDANQFIYFQF